MHKTEPILVPFQKSSVHTTYAGSILLTLIDPFLIVADNP